MRHSILAIDDSRFIHDLIRVSFAEETYRMEWAFTGDAGLAWALEKTPDLILLDVDLPDMNGFDVCRHLKANSKTAAIPVIFLTASSSVDERIAGLLLEPADYVLKPWEPMELALRVRAALKVQDRFRMVSAAASQMLDAGHYGLLTTPAVAA